MSITVFARVVCAYCDRTVAVLRTGKLRRHGRGWLCQGSHTDEGGHPRAPTYDVIRAGLDAGSEE